MPLVTQVFGDIIAGGNRIRLHVIVDDDEVNELDLARNDVQPFIALLLDLGSRALHRSGTDQEPSIASARPFPVDVVTLGGDAHGKPVLVFNVGATALAFSFASDQLAELGRALLTASTPTAGARN